jgi:hypothetical protein
MGWFSSKRKKKQKRRVQSSIKQGKKFQREQIKLAKKEEKRFREREKREEKRFLNERKKFEKEHKKYRKELNKKEKVAQKEAAGRRHYYEKQQKKFSPTDARFEKLNRLNPEQEAALSNILGGVNQNNLNPQAQPTYQAGENYLQNLLSNSNDAFSKFEAPYKRQFEEEIIPQIAERFTGQNARNSSAFRNALGQQGAALSERLAALREGLRMQAVPEAFKYGSQPSELQAKLASLGLGTQTREYGNIPGRQGTFLGSPTIPTFLPREPTAPQSPQYYRRDAYNPTFAQPTVDTTNFDRFSQNFATKLGESLGALPGQFAGGKFAGGNAAAAS